MRNQTEILNALVDAKARGVKVRGVIDRTLDGKNYYSSSEALVTQLGSVRDDQRADAALAKEQARKERGRGAPAPACQGPEGHAGYVQCLAYDLGDRCLMAAHASREALNSREAIMHNKFFVVDGESVWTGSTNVSDACAGGYNANIAIVLHNRQIARWYREEFERMWGKGQYHRLKPKSEAPRVVEIGDTKIELLFSPQDHAMQTRVRRLVRDAKKSVHVAVFFLTHKQIAADLIAAKLRGVDVQVIIDANGASNEYSKHELLRAAGIPVKVEDWGGKMHMKSAVIDGEVVVAGSMNWTSAGENENDENTLILHSRRLAAQYETVFQNMWLAIDDRWRAGRPGAETQLSGTACSDGMDNDHDGLRDQDDPSCAADFVMSDDDPRWWIVPKGDRRFCAHQGESVAGSEAAPGSEHPLDGWVGAESAEEY